MNPTISLLNGDSTTPFSSSSGVRQGDPLSPQLFLIAMQILTALFERAEAQGKIDPFTCWNLTVSHIIFAVTIGGSAGHLRE